MAFMMTSKSTRVLLLGGEGLTTHVVANALDANTDLLAMVIEPRPARSTLIRGRLRRLGPGRVLDQLVFQALAAPIVQKMSRSRIREIREQNLLDITTPSAVRHDVENVNTSDCLAWIAHYKPDVIVINGTRILSAKTLSSIDVPVLNLHAGITPTYRGVHGGYWSLVEQDAAHFGATVHRVDAGIDTGKVIAYATAKPTLDDSFATYPWLQLAAGLPALIQAAQNLTQGADAQSIQPPPTRELRYHPGIRTYLWHRWMWGVR